MLDSCESVDRDHSQRGAADAATSFLAGNDLHPHFGEITAVGKKVHVVPHTDGWAVKKDGADRASSIHDTQKQAQQAAIPLAKQEKSEVVTHGRDGKIRDSDSYGNDPNPPKDTKH